MPDYKVVDATQLNTDMTSVADAIRAKGGTMEKLAWPDGFVSAVEAIQSGSTAVASPKDVNFYDYDGTLVYSYTLAEAQALTALPDGPTHDGLVFQGWNWSLESVKALTYTMNVGAMYITDDGKTRLKIRIWDKARSNVPLYFKQSVAHGVTIDWGDGGATETLDGTGYVNTSHQYGAKGDYTIALAVAEGCTLELGSGSAAYCVLGKTDNAGTVYRSMLQEVAIGNGVTTMGTRSFQDCYSLSAITMPNSVTGFGNSPFSSCRSLSAITIPNSVTVIGGIMVGSCHTLSTITIPNSVTSIGGQVFQDCYSLSAITIPDSVTSIGYVPFQQCRSLSAITVPNSVTVIGGSAFNNCIGMAEYHFKATTPPKLGNATVFDRIPSDCIIYVPVGSLEAYKTATNWSTYADKMREEQV